MSEHRDTSGESSARPAADAASSPAPLVIGSAEPDDNAPTVISKAPQAASFLSGSVQGRTLAHFELLEPVGVGGMAAVIKARDKQLDRSVALKILPPEMAQDAEIVRRFHQEARAAAKLDHENIARVFYCGEDQRLHFIAFEFVEGLNLRTLLERRGRLPVAEAVHYLLQIATGLAHAAARNVVHRDIKPSNIIITPTGRAKLVDMGLARSQMPHGDKQLTQSGVTLGTFDYISPEQALEPRDADVRSDIYSLGCTFYHMLTGQPPVPEGTAARKLHHHQHVAPVDPRQLNAAIPDEVAVVLGRMMAKDPRGRYQRAEHLVQHLIQLAQKLGGSPDLPEGVLFVDAALPLPPRKRPLLMGAIAVLALGVLLVGLSLVPPRSPTPQLTRNLLPDPPRKDKKGGAPLDDKKAVQPPVALEAVARVANEADLQEALAEDRTHTTIVVEKDLKIGEGGLTFRGGLDRPLVIEGRDAKDGKKGPLLRFVADAAAVEAMEFLAGLVIEGGKVEFRNLQFKVKADTTPGMLVAAVAARKGATVTFKQCTFLQDTPVERLLSDDGLVPVASVAAWNPNPEATDKDRPRLAFEECYFVKGQAAVSITGTATVKQDNCALGPHLTLYHLRGKDRKWETELQLANVSAFVVHGPAFRLDEGATGLVTVVHSIFSSPSQEPSKGDPPQFIHQTASTLLGLKYDGRRNAYHGINAFLARPVGAERAPPESYEEFKNVLKELKGSDDNSVNLAFSPWASPTPLTEKDPAEAFKVRGDKAEVRQVTQTRLIGVERGVWGVYPRPPSLDQAVPETVVRKSNEYIVDPEAKNPGVRVFTKLAAALHEAKEDAIIYIKHTGDVPMTPVTINAERKLTLRPYEKHRPILKLDKKSGDLEPALFHVTTGQIQFENLEFHLTPGKSRLGESIVALSGNGQCSFKQCVLTLEAAREGPLSQVPLSVVALLDAKDAMKMTEPEPAPRPYTELKFQDCFVRGEGDLVTVRAGRPIDLKAENCLVVLTGSLVNVEGTTEALGGFGHKINLARVTTYLQEHLLLLRTGKSGKGLHYTEVDAADCLFAAGNGKSLVHLDGTDSEAQMKNLFAWKGQHNAYNHYDENLLDQAVSGDATPKVVYAAEAWKDFARERETPEARFTRVRFEGPAAADRPLHQAQAEEFKARGEGASEVQGYGAMLEQLPRPAGVELPATSGIEEAMLDARRRRFSFGGQ